MDRAGLGATPIFNIADRVPVGYELLLRGAPASDWTSLPLDAIAELAERMVPAVVLLPIAAAERWLAGAGGPVLPQARQLVWKTSSRTTDMALLRRVRALGSAVALELHGWPGAGHMTLRDVEPEYVLLPARCARELRSDRYMSAEVAALVSLATRLDIRLIARGASSKAIATALTDHGVQLGMGSHLHRSIVFSPSAARRGDVVVPASWFQRHQARRLDSQAPSAHRTAALHTMPRHGAGTLDASGFGSAVAHFARSLQNEHSADRLLDIAAARIREMIPVSALAIFEADWDADQLVPRVLMGSRIAALRDRAVAMSQGITGWAFRRGEPFNCGSTSSHPAAGTIPGTEDDRSEESLLVVPLVAADRRIGVLDLWRLGADRFSDEDLERASLIGHLVAAAWNSARLYGELEERARTDSLTGLHNARWWHERVAQEEARIVRSGSETGVLLLDVDHFKFINDSGGHALGDNALRMVAQTLRAAVRLGDEVVRYGGEEFLVLLHQSGEEGAMAVAENLRRSVACMPSIGPGLNLTVSIGVATFPAHGPTLEDAVRAADGAMYEAKQRGRDRVVIATPVQRLSELIS